MKKIFCRLMTTKKNLTRRGGYIFISMPSMTDIMLPVGQAITLKHQKDVCELQIGTNGLQTPLSFDSVEDKDLFIKDLQRLLVPSLFKRSLKWLSICLLGGFVYMVWGAYQQAQDMIKTDTAWAKDPSAIAKTLPNLASKEQPVQGGIDAILANRLPQQPQPDQAIVADNLDALLSQTGPVLPPQSPMAKQMFEQAMSVGREEYLNAIPPSTSSAGLDAFGLSTAGAGCDPALAFDK
ncbi:hypothetical protein [Aeromonas caviae]|uniref:hypothetical protein n=1 Tax=Aeromonas caviae TaxID=648 RepID=UPI002448F9F3|nr:hypothetical protein [Aeromonas caviae]MDH1848063.1 hypothetical protein [Aeromonas caviae]